MFKITKITTIPCTLAVLALAFVCLPAATAQASEKKLCWPTIDFKSLVSKSKSMVCKDRLTEMIEDEDFADYFCGCHFKEGFIKKVVLDLSLEVCHNHRRRLLSWCDCDAAPANTRIEMLMMQLREIIKKHPDKEQKFVHTEFGEEKGLQSLLLAYALLLAGYVDIEINLVGEYPLDGVAQKINNRIKNLSGEEINFVARSFQPNEGELQYEAYINETTSSDQETSAKKSMSFAMTDMNDMNEDQRICADFNKMMYAARANDDPIVFLLYCKNVTDKTKRFSRWIKGKLRAEKKATESSSD